MKLFSIALFFVLSFSLTSSAFAQRVGDIANAPATMTPAKGTTAIPTYNATPVPTFTVGSSLSSPKTTGVVTISPQGVPTVANSQYKGTSSGMLKNGTAPSQMPIDATVQDQGNRTSATDSAVTGGSGTKIKTGMGR